MNRLFVKHVTKHFGKRVALEDVSLTVREGEFLCLVGPSGCGKSTLLNLIAGLDRPDEGEIIDDGEVVTEPGQERMLMFQDAALFPWLNVWNNVLFGLKLKPGLRRRERKLIAMKFLEMVRLKEHRFAYAHELSGGMRQRASLARALAPNPNLLLMDEPFASLDAMTREQFYEDLQEIWLKEKKTILLVTHNVAEAVTLGDRILTFTDSPGTISREYLIDLPRPRDIRSLAIAERAAKITADLRKEIRRLL